MRLLPLILLAACTVAEPAVEPLPPLGDHALLQRLSLDLRGERPAAEDYARIDANPDALDAMVDEFLEEEGFGRRVEDWFAPRIGTRIDTFGVAATDFGLPEGEGAYFTRSVGDEPLRILREVAVQDLPWTDVVTAEWTMANELLGDIWPVDYPANLTGWRRVAWTDGRPPAGILASNALWWRYPSDGVNYNRGRANAVSRMFLCRDYLQRDVAFPRDLDLTDPELVANAIATNDGCANCHVSLDSLGSYLFGFQYVDREDASDIAVYHPERERLWEGATGVAPAFFGQPGYNLSDLGHQLAGDPRYVECAVQTVYEALLGREVTFEDTSALTSHREAFLSGGLTLRSLVRSVVSDERYRSSVGERGGVPTKLASPSLMASQVEALTDFRLEASGYDLMETDLIGLRTLAGGADGATVSRVADTPTPTMLLVQQRLAEAAAYKLMSTDNEARQRLFPGGVPVDPTLGADAFAAQIQRLHLAFYGRNIPVDGAEVASNVALWNELRAVGDAPERAWADLISVLLRDPDLLLY